MDSVRERLAEVIRQAIVEHDDGSFSCVWAATDAILAAFPELAGWEDIATAPRDGTAMWLWCDGMAYLGHFEPPDAFSEGQWILKAFIRSRRERRLPDEIIGIYEHHAAPTHWRPLPAPPAERREG